MQQNLTDKYCHQLSITKFDSIDKYYQQTPVTNFDNTNKYYLQIPIKISLQH